MMHYASTWGCQLESPMILDLSLPMLFRIALTECLHDERISGRTRCRLLAIDYELEAHICPRLAKLDVAEEAYL